jgi:hypothetical protein
MEMRSRTVQPAAVGVLIVFLIAPAAFPAGLGSEPALASPPYASGPVHTVRPGPVDIAALEAEDEAQAGKGLPFRFGAPFDVSYDLATTGVWSALPNGDRVWRLRIECPGAHSINLIFDRFWLPEGAALIVASEDGTSLLGPFTAFDNTEHGRFATAPTRASVCLLEYREPQAAAGRGRLRISRVVHGYKSVFGLRGLKGFGDAGDCNVDVTCAAGAGWEDQARAVAMILCDRGTRCCTGVLVNNVREDQTPYFLTANHCVVAPEDGDVEDLSTWVVMFNYDSPACQDVEGPTTDTVTGAVLVAREEETDFALLKLRVPPPPEYNVFYAGWSAEEADPRSSATIHHPRGDTKKISFDDDPARSSISPFGTGFALTHWRVDWEIGTTEPGSSGSPLFDQNHRVVGHLTGGEASCEFDLPDYYGKTAASWQAGSNPGARLRDWLDPDGTGRLVLDGMAPADTPPAVTITNPAPGDVVAGIITIRVTASDDKGVSGVEFRINDVPAATDPKAPFEHAWNTAGLPLGFYTLEAVATDTAGASAAAAVTVRLAADCDGNGVADELDIASGAVPDTNGNGVPDTCEDLVPFRRGDADADGRRNVGDAVFTLMYLFRGTAEPPCLNAADANDDGAVNLADAVTTLTFLFRAGFMPEPVNACAPDPTPDSLDCKAFAPCGP